MLGPVLERLQNELLDPLIEMTFDYMVEAGIVPPPPEELANMELNVEFVSMLAQAQRAVGTNSIDRFINSMGAVAQAKPEVLDKLNTDKWADHYADMLGVDPELVVPEDEVLKIRAARAKAQQQAQQMQNVEQATGAAKNLAGADMSGNNALTNIINQFSGYGSPSPQEY